MGHQLWKRTIVGYPEGLVKQGSPPQFVTWEIVLRFGSDWERYTQRRWMVVTIREDELELSCKRESNDLYKIRQHGLVHPMEELQVFYNQTDRKWIATFKLFDYKEYMVLLPPPVSCSWKIDGNKSTKTTPGASSQIRLQQHLYLSAGPLCLSYFLTHKKYERRRRHLTQSFELHWLGTPNSAPHIN